MPKPLFNESEKRTNTRLKEICDEYGASIYPKIRIADVLPIENSGLNADLYQFALKSHFDFVIYNSLDLPLFAIEFDGPTHNSKTQITRDQKKDTLCKYFTFPILRINNLYLEKKYRNYDLLACFVDIWFLREFFFEAQDNGALSKDLCFDPMAIIDYPKRKNSFPFFLSLDIRVKIQNLQKNRRCLSFAPSEWIGIDGKGNYYGITWLQIDEDTGVVVSTGMKSQCFPIYSEILSELLCFLIYDKLTKILNGASSGTPWQDIPSLIQKFTCKYEKRMSFMISPIKSS